MYNGQNEYVPYKKRTKRLSNGQGTHLPETDRQDNLFLSDHIHMTYEEKTYIQHDNYDTNYYSCSRVTAEGM